MKKGISITMDVNLIQLAKDKAKKEHRTLSNLLEFLLANYLIKESLKKKENGNQKV